jgi:hypothetical protein
LRASLLGRDGVATLSKQAFFEELLRLVYRLIFLATIEDRVDHATGQALVFAPGVDKAIRARYLDGYSLTMLRARAARRSAHDTHHDLWQALSITFAGLACGEAALGLPAIGGLFDADQGEHLALASIENRWLLTAVFQLGYFRERTGLTRVNYRDMGPEELGSVYESLLELVPDIRNLAQPNATHFCFVGDPGDEPVSALGVADKPSTKGNTRKLTGSYYTPDSLVQELIKSALEPVIEQTLRDNPARPVAALLDFSICDPACGRGTSCCLPPAGWPTSWRLQRAAAEREGGAPTPADYRHALRDVVSHCLFGVDKNPMAIQLAKTALWLEAYTPDLPLSFIDHHLRVGDALLGVLDPKVLEERHPRRGLQRALKRRQGGGQALKKQNKADLKSWRAIAAGDLLRPGRPGQPQPWRWKPWTTTRLSSLLPSAPPGGRLRARQSARCFARLADTYVAAFLAPKLAEHAEHRAAVRLSVGRSQRAARPPRWKAPRRRCAATHGAFHWWLAFPQVAAKGGFDVMLGNPPWERIKLQEEEFFASRSPLVAMARNKAERSQRIEWLRDGVLLHNLDPDQEAAEGLSPPNRAEKTLYDAFVAARRGAEAASLFAHSSGRFPLTGVGDVNTYALFAETFLQSTAAKGRAGFIVPTGIATDDSTKAYFERLAIGGHLRSMLCLENEEFVFPSVHHAFRFALLTLAGCATTEAATLVFFARQPGQIHDANRRFTLTPPEFRLINPNTRTCPVFRSERDAELTKKLYRAAPILIKEAVSDANGKVLEPEVNPWGVRFQTMFHMSGDSGLFHHSPTSDDARGRLPLYEAKMIHHFDHRWATYVDADGRPGEVETVNVTPAQKADPAFTVRPRYWVDEREVLARIARVPAKVAKAWLATHETAARSGSPAADEALAKLLLALAAWVAGELFSRAAGPSDAGESSPQRALPYLAPTEAELKARFSRLSQALVGAGLNTRKALVDFPKWAAQNQDARLSDAELADLATALDSRELDAALRTLLDSWMDARSPRWLLGWRDITGVEKVRTVIAEVVPRAGVGHTMPLAFSVEPPRLLAALLGNWLSMTFDYAARQKVGGTHLTYGFLKQLPVLSPEQYLPADLDFIVPRVLELTYTAHDLKAWAEELGYHGEPFVWNPDRRAQLRAELDACYARLYGLSRNELRYILDPADMMGADYPSETFRVLKEGERRAYGEYRTQRLVLEAWDQQSQLRGA